MTEEELADEFAKADEYSGSLLLELVTADTSYMDGWAYVEDGGYRVDQAMKHWWMRRYPAVWSKLYRMWQRSGVDGEEGRIRHFRRKGKNDL